MKHYQRLLEERRNKYNKEQQEMLNVPIYEKNFLVNEELNSIAGELQAKIDKKSELND